MTLRTIAFGDWLASDRGRLVVRWLATILLVAVGTAISWSYFSRPTTLKVAVGPAGSKREAFVAALARSLAESKATVRLKLVPVKGSAEAAALLEADKVQLAVLRSDEPSIADARSIVVLDRRSVVLAMRGDPKAKSATSKDTSPETQETAEDSTATMSSFAPERIAGKRLLVAVDEMGSNLVSVRRLLAHSGLVEPGISIREAPADAIATELAAGRADIAVYLVDPSETGTRIMIAQLTEKLAGAVIVGGVPSPEGLAAIYRDVASTSLATGVFGGIHPLPAEKITTVAMTDELVAESDMSDAIGAQLTRALLDKRGRMLAQSTAFELEAPPLDTLRRFMPHSGVSALINERSTSFLEKYSDQIWLALFAVGLLGSSLMSLGNRLGLSRGSQTAKLLGEVDRLGESIEASTTVEEVDAIRRRIRELARVGIKTVMQRGLDANDPSHPTHWFEFLDEIAVRRRSEIEAASPMPPETSAPLRSVQGR